MQHPATVARDVSVSKTGEVDYTGPGLVLGYDFGSIDTADAFVKLYDTAAVPDETGTPILTIHVAKGGDKVVQLARPVPFSAGLAHRATAGMADNDTIDVGANKVCLNIFYHKGIL